MSETQKEILIKAIGDDDTENCLPIRINNEPTVRIQVFSSDDNQSSLSIQTIKD